MILETERLYLREMESSDYPALCKILQDKEVMYAYEHAFDDNEVREWLLKQLNRYEEDGFGLWAVIEKETGEMIGQCGLTMQQCGEKEVIEAGYLFQKAYWHKGYATEAARACKKYAFDTLGVDEVFSIIRDNNIASQKVAKRNNMTERGSIIKHYYNIDMPHLVFSVKKSEENIRIWKAEKKHIKDVIKLAELLWPGHAGDDLEKEFSLLVDAENAAIFLLSENDQAAGFAQCQLRHDYVEGTNSSPVGYLEGIFVKEEYRGRGFGGLLLKEGEKWARLSGCSEFASDCDIYNKKSLEFHLSKGFKEANRIICFTKKFI